MEDRDSFDYVLNLDDFIKQRGQNYRQLRKKIRRFDRKYPYVETKLLDLTLARDVSMVEELTYNWCVEKKNDYQRSRRINKQSTYLLLIY